MTEFHDDVDQILETSLKDAEMKGGVCPLCGHSKEVPYSHRKTVLFGLLLATLLVTVVVGIGFQSSRQTQRAAIAGEAVARMGTNADVVRLIGTPMTIERGLQGEIKQDETGWKEAHLTIPVRGPLGDATAHVVGGRGTGPWVFTTFEIDFEKQHEKVDLVSGRPSDARPLSRGGKSLRWEVGGFAKCADRPPHQITGFRVPTKRMKSPRVG